jgi:uncharacterized protein YbjT (DUF2867 family)
MVMSTYLITQATGRQSQWVITHLLETGASIHAVVRNPEKELPPILKRPGVVVFQGESDNLESISRAAQGCTGVFLNTFPIPDLEIQQAKTVVKACKDADVKSIVVSTTFQAGIQGLWDDDWTRDSGLYDYFASKAKVENVVRSAGFEAYTILRPAFIHFDYLLPYVYRHYPDLPATGQLLHAYDDNTKMFHIDASDIGRYAAKALENPSDFHGQEIHLANEGLTIEQTRAILAKVSGREIRTRKRTPAAIEEAKKTVPGQRFQIWSNGKDLSAFDSNATEVSTKFGIPFTSLELALQREKDQLMECLAASTS